MLGLMIPVSASVQEQSNETGGMDGNATISEYVDSQNQTQTLEWLTYDDPILGISVQYPKGWEIEELPSVVKFKYGAGPDYYDVVTSITASPSYYNSSEDYMKSVMNSARGEVEKIHSISPVSIAGLPAYKVESSFKDDPTEQYQLRHTTDYFIVDTTNKMEYYIVISLPENNYEDIQAKYQPAIQKMVGSFKIRE